MRSKKAYRYTLSNQEKLEKLNELVAEYHVHTDDDNNEAIAVFIRNTQWVREELYNYIGVLPSELAAAISSTSVDFHVNAIEVASLAFGELGAVWFEDGVFYSEPPESAPDHVKLQYKYRKSVDKHAARMLQRLNQHIEKGFWNTRNAKGFFIQRAFSKIVGGGYGTDSMPLPTMATLPDNGGFSVFKNRGVDASNYLMMAVELAEAETMAAINANLQKINESRLPIEEYDSEYILVNNDDRLKVLLSELGYTPEQIEFETTEGNWVTEDKKFFVITDFAATLGATSWQHGVFVCESLD